MSRSMKEALIYLVSYCIGCLLFGMGLSLVIYDRYLCCDKSIDHIYYLGIGLVLILFPIISLIIQDIKYERGKN